MTQNDLKMLFWLWIAGFKPAKIERTETGIRVTWKHVLSA